MGETKAKTNTGTGKKLFPKIAFITVAVIIAAAIIASSYFFVQYRNAQKLLKNPTLVAAQDSKSLVSKVSNLIELPKGEDPTIATISDINQLKAQPFYKNAQNGDKVLIFIKAKRAILYRPSINKIIEVAPINDESQQSASQSASKALSPTLTASPKNVKITKIAIYNGTKTAGLAGSYATQITEKIANIEVVKKDNAKGDYAGILVVDLTGGNSDMSKQIASILNGKVGALPESEIKPDADILVIIGE